MPPKNPLKDIPADGHERPRVQHWEVSDDQAGQRIDNFLMARLKGVPKARIFRMLRGGEVRVNAARVANDYRLKAGDALRIPPVHLADPVLGPELKRASGPISPALARSINQQIKPVFSDESMLAIDKPYGIAVHGGSGVKLGVIEALRQSGEDRKTKGEPFLELVHRLDRETSGVMLLARRRQALVEFHRQLREGEMKKRYLALVWGSWPQSVVRIERPLHKWVNAKGERWVRPQEDGQTAVTRVKCLSRIEDPRIGWVSLLQCEPLTGRTHQLRVHLQSEGFPIVGDPKYGDDERNSKAKLLGFRRMFLHAWQLRCIHPKTKEILNLVANLDELSSTFLQELGLNAP